MKLAILLAVALLLLYLWRREPERLPVVEDDLDWLQHFAAMWERATEPYQWGPSEADWSRR